jgi:protein MpaA
MKLIKKSYSKENREIRLYEQEGKGKTILIVGVVHGEEPQGKTLIENYIEKECKNHLLFIPCLNPDGFVKNCRQNSNGVDLNRNFPTKNWIKSEKNQYFGGEEPASEIETKFVIDIFEKYSPELILTIHAPYKVVNYDGPAQVYAEKISEIIGYETSSDIGYPTPGSMGNFFGVERNIPIITLELDETVPVENLQGKINAIFDYIGNC